MSGPGPRPVEPELFTLSDDDDVEMQAVVLVDVGGGSEGGPQMEVNRVNSPFDSSYDTSSSDESTGSSKYTSEDEGTLQGEDESDDDTKKNGKATSDKLIDDYVDEADKRKLDLGCGAVPENEQSEVDLEGPEAKRPRVTPFAVGLNGHVIIPEGAEPLDVKYEESLKAFVENQKALVKANFIMEPMDTMITDFKIEESESDTKQLEIGYIKTEEMDGEKDQFQIGDIKTEKTLDETEQFQIGGIKTDEMGGEKEKLQIGDIKTEESESDTKQLEIGHIKAEETGGYSGQLQIGYIKSEEMDGEKEQFQIGDVKTEASTSGTEVVPAQFRNAADKTWFYGQCEKLANNVSLIKDKVNAARRMEIAMLLRVVKPMDRPGVREGRIAIIGNPQMEAAKALIRFFESEFGLGENVVLIPPSNLEGLLKECQEMRENSPWKYFMYLFDCDDGFDTPFLVNEVKLFRKYMAFEKDTAKDRFDVYNCRSIRNTKRNYPPISFMAKLVSRLRFENRSLFYDVDEQVRRQCEFARSRYIQFASGMYLLRSNWD